MVNLNSPADLLHEFEEVKHSFSEYHDEMNFALDAYKNNVYYPQKPNAPKRTSKGVNLLEVFADKLWDYLAPFPKISVPSRPETKEIDDLKEKILHATHMANGSEVRWTKQMFDGVVMSCVITAIEPDFRQMCPKIKRIDPRRAFWQKADATSDKIQTLWYVEPMTDTAIKKQYGVTPTGEGMTFEDLSDLDVIPQDGQNYYLVITRVDDDTFVKWVGNKLLSKPIKHMMGRLPADIAFPLEIASYNKRGDFYMRKLYELQAEFNEYWRQRGNVVRKLGNPTVWGRGIKQKQFQPVKESMSMDGGFVGLQETGELGILTIPETKMIDTALADTFQRMKDKAGFPTATFGEVVGANTSGDALGMYFQPTTRMVDKMNTALKQHLVIINAMVLKWYATFLPADQTKTLDGVIPHARYEEVDGQMMPMMGQYQIEFNKFILGKNFSSVVIMNPVTPKDDVNYKRLMLDAARENVISRTTFYEEMGFLSPKDELAMLTEEQSNPALNPQGTQQIMDGALKAQQVGAGLPAQATGV